MNVLLTGASGFIGAHVVERLVESGAHRVSVLLRPGSDPWRIQHRLRDLRVVAGTLDDPRLLAEALAEIRPDTLIHLAWTGMASAVRNDVVQIANLCSTLGLLSLAVDGGVRHVVALGSQAEQAAPPSLYGTAKVCASLMGQRLCEERGVRFAWLRLFAAYGPKDNAFWLIPSLTLSLLAGRRPALTSGAQRRDYLFVRDAAEAICLTAETTSASGVYELGSGRAVAVRTIAERLRDLVDPALSLGFGELPYGADCVMHLEARCERLEQETGWHASTPLERGLEETVRWYREHGSRGSGGP
jgi:nucleoside-diphosphate-sugar epimerase